MYLMCRVMTNARVNIIVISLFISLLISLLMSLLIVSQTLANTHLVTEKVTNTEQPSTQQFVDAELPINPLLFSLMSQIKRSGLTKEEIDIALAQLTLSKEPLNVAEQYLLLVLKALFEEKRSDTENKSQTIINLLKQATDFEKKISAQQLSQPEFIQLHLLLARHYANDGLYDLAYLEKAAYLEKYHVYRKNKRVLMIASLKQSFDVQDKKASNALLESQNALNIIRVAEVQEQQSSQQYNVMLIISTACVFVLLFFRQLKIRTKLVKLSKTDGLTGIANRNILFEQGGEMVANFADKPSEFSVLLIDFDHFKKINDNFGPRVGDRILKQVATLIQETMRSRDVFARLGGEEFVALLPFADSNKAKAIAMRINEKIAHYDFSTLMEQATITVSIGVATMENNNMTFDDVLHDADLAMHQAKEAGRNTVLCYQNIAVKKERRVNRSAS